MAERYYIQDISSDSDSMGQPYLEVSIIGWLPVWIWCTRWAEDFVVNFRSGAAIPKVHAVCGDLRQLLGWWNLVHQQAAHAQIVRLSSSEGTEVNNYHIFTILLVGMPFRKISPDVKQCKGYREAHLRQCRVFCVFFYCFLALTTVDQRNFWGSRSELDGDSSAISSSSSESSMYLADLRAIWLDVGMA